MLAFGPGERIEWGGQYRLLAAGPAPSGDHRPARRRFDAGAPVSAVSQHDRGAHRVASVPFALVGSFWTLYLLDYPLSAPVWVGLLSVVGLAMQTGVVMVVYIDDAFHRRLRQGLIRPATTSSRRTRRERCGGFVPS